MTETAKQDFSPEEIENDDIASDDPLFELSRIIGFDDEAPASVAVDPQIDLEEALMAEMAAPALQPDYEDAPSDDIEPEATIEQLEPAAIEAVLEEPVSEEPVLGSSVSEEPILEEIDLAEANFTADAATMDLKAELDADTDFEVASDTFENVEPSSAPTAASLEDELAAMLGDDVTVATEISDFDDVLADAEIAGAQNGAVDAIHNFDAPTETDVNSAFEEIVELENVVAQPSAPMSYATPLPPEFAGASDHTNELEEPFEEIINYSADETVDLHDTSVEVTAQEADSDLDLELDDNFAAFFDEDLPAFEDEVPAHDASAFDSGINDAAAILEADIAAQSPEMSTKPEAESVAPILETTDMSGFAVSDAAAIDVPELPDLDTEFASTFQDDLSADTAGDQTSNAGVAAATATAGMAAVAGAGALARRAGETAMANDDDAFDESRFEAELARDMEFVSHDLNTGSEQDDLSLDSGFEDQEFAMAAADAKPAKGGLVIAAVLGCVAIAGAVGVFAYSGSQTSGTDGPVLVEAPSDPVKVAPVDPGGKQVPNQDRAVFNETAAAPAQEALGTTSEEPVDIAAVPESALPTDLNGADSQKGEARLLPDDTIAASNDTSAVVAPRRVRTLVVKPDGTLVERAVVPTPEPVTPAPVAEAPAETATAPATPAANQDVTFNAPAAETPDVPVAEAPAEEVANSNETVVETEAPAPAAAEVTPTVPTAPARNVATQKVVAPSQIAERPKDQPVTIVNNDATQVAAAEAPTAAPTPAPTAAAASDYVVQVSSQPSQELAQKSASNFSRQFGNVIGNRGVTIRRAVIDGRGTFYRVRINSESRADANSLCGRIKSAGGDCFVTR